ncbi:MAG: hypothetical protein C4538_05265 [Nitrospiraceae bacterium]|nr:MAG: hypothetical protein C4538_05265 [Nitrospiraceae bacterium]
METWQSGEIMEHEDEKILAEKYALRFGQIAVDKGFVSSEQVRQALDIQMSVVNASRLRPHKLIGEILFEKGWMTMKQIENVLAEIFRDK